MCFKCFGHAYSFISTFVWVNNKVKRVWSTCFSHRHAEYKVNPHLKRITACKHLFQLTKTFISSSGSFVIFEHPRTISDVLLISNETIFSKSTRLFFLINWSGSWEIVSKIYYTVKWGYLGLSSFTIYLLKNVSTVTIYRYFVWPKILSYFLFIWVFIICNSYSISYLIFSMIQYKNTCK